jgi:DNA modification methylase
MNELSVSEQADLERLEAIIGAGLQTFVEVGSALAEVRDRRLYRQEFGTFEEYCRERWGMVRSRAYQLIDAAGVAANVHNCGRTAPANEAQVRPLASLDPVGQREAWALAVATAPNGRPTAAHVSSVVAGLSSQNGSPAAGSAPTPARPDIGDAGGPDRAGRCVILRADARDTSLPHRSVHAIVTSPPFFGLRNYGLGPDQLGLEGTVEEYVANLVAAFRPAREALRDDGVAWVNLGDVHRDGRLIDVVGLAQRGFEADGWICVDKIVWAKALMLGDTLRGGGCMPGSQRGRCTTSHEYILQLVKRQPYYFDIHGKRARSRAALRSVWKVKAAPNDAAHFAPFPPDLAATCIRLATSARGVCAACGSPWERVTERVRIPTRSGRNSKVNRASRHPDSPAHAHGGLTVGNRDPLRHTTAYRTVDWVPTCKCGTGEVVPATVLDPFAGSGTTGLAAVRYGRDAVLIELNPEYAEGARRRLEDEGIIPVVG